MKPLRRNTYLREITSGIALVLLGSAIGIWLPTNVALAITGFVLLRIFWLEDNIHSDLLSAKKIPQAYENTQILRDRMFGIQAPGTTIVGPRRLAEELRLQSLCWSTFSWSALAGVLLTAPSPIAIAAGLGSLAMGLRAADRHGHSCVSVRSGKPLPPRILEARGILQDLATNRSDRK